MSEWLPDVRAKLKRSNKVLFSPDNPLFSELTDAISQTNHKAMVLWALELATGTVNTLNERYPSESRPQIALDTSRAWAAGQVKMREAQRAILHCHAVAKEIDSPEDIALCHAVGQACGVVHTSGHAMGFPVYELTALVHHYGVENCDEAIESRIAYYTERVDYWREHFSDHQGPWATFFEKDNEVSAHLAPIQSLLSKSEKAVAKVQEETWQHTMLTNNIKALTLAAALMTNESVKASPQQMHDALNAFADMIRRTEESGSKFAEGTAQHTLQANRLEALRLAASLIKKSLCGEPVTTIPG